MSYILYCRWDAIVKGPKQTMIRFNLFRFKVEKLQEHLRFRSEYSFSPRAHHQLAHKFKTLEAKL